MATDINKLEKLSTKDDSWEANALWRIENRSLMDKNTHGGNRPGAGRKKGEETTTVSIRVSKSFKNDLMKKYKGKLNKMIYDFLKTLSMII